MTDNESILVATERVKAYLTLCKAFDKLIDVSDEQSKREFGDWLKVQIKAYKDLIEEDIL